MLLFRKNDILRRGRAAEAVRRLVLTVVAVAVQKADPQSRKKVSEKEVGSSDASLAQCIVIVFGV